MFDDLECIDRVGAIVSVVAGVSPSIVGGASIVAVDDMLEMGCSGRKILTARLQQFSEPGAVAISIFIDQFTYNWASLSTPITDVNHDNAELQTAAMLFQKFFNEENSRPIPSSDIIIEQGRDPVRLANALLSHAETTCPESYSDSSSNKINRVLFYEVIYQGLSLLFYLKSFAQTLVPAFRVLTIGPQSQLAENRWHDHRQKLPMKQANSVFIGLSAFAVIFLFVAASLRPNCFHEHHPVMTEALQKDLY